MSEPQTTDELAEYRWSMRSAVVYRAQMSALYHRDREAFFERLDRASKMLALLASGAALADVLGPEQRKLLLVVVACSSAGSIAFSWGEKARLHADLASRWTMLEAEIERVGPHDFSDQNLSAWKSRRAEIEASEPPHSEALIQKIQNRLAAARGKPSDVHALGLLSRVRAVFGV